MTQAPETRISLVARLSDLEDRQAWHTFVDIYAPLLHGYLRKRGLQDADAADLTQDVLQSVANHAGRFSYDRSQGSFRGWLFTITRNRLRDFGRQAGRRAMVAGKSSIRSLLQALPEREAESLWEHEHQWRLFHWAASQAKVDFRAQTWSAFWRNAVHHRSAKEVAAELNISAGAVHIAKSRCLARIRQILESVEAESVVMGTGAGCP